MARSRTRGGNPTANVQLGDERIRRVSGRTETQTRVEDTTRVSNARGQALGNLARMYTAGKSRLASIVNAPRTYRQGELRRYTSGNEPKRYQSDVRRSDRADENLGLVRGVGTTRNKRFTVVPKQPDIGEQPRDSGNGNSPITISARGTTFRASGSTNARIRATVNARRGR